MTTPTDLQPSFWRSASLSLVLVAALTLLSACGSGQTTPTNETPSGTLAAETQAASQGTGAAQNGTRSTPTNTPEATPSFFLHIVQADETLSSIAAFYGLPIDQLLTANGLQLDSVIRADQRLVIPLPPSQAGTWHAVAFGETLTQIASDYGSTPDAIRAANGLTSADTILVGVRLRIPLVPPDDLANQPFILIPTSVPTSTPVVTSTPAPTYALQWPRSVLEGNLNENYPLSYLQDRFTMHFQPGTYPAYHIEETAALIADGLRNAEQTLGVTLDGTFDVYVAGTLFAAPNANLRGYSRSVDRDVFILHDGTGTPAEQAYFFAHELMHLVAWNTLGSPSSTILSEGLATYAGKNILEGGGNLPFSQICLSLYKSGTLPSMATIEQDWQAFQGHLEDFPNYFASACFVDYLISTYGVETVSALYHTSDYTGLTGKTLSQLDASWQTTYRSLPVQPGLDPSQMNTLSQSLGRVYTYIFDNYDNSPAMERAYRAADRARTALWQGDINAAQDALDEATGILGFTP